jgi:hypothetical protein
VAEIARDLATGDERDAVSGEDRRRSLQISGSVIGERDRLDTE